MLRRRTPTIASLIVLLAASSVWSQSAQNSTAPLAPAVPALSTELDLFVREITAGDRSARSVRIVRMGEGGVLERPGVVDLPREGRSLVVAQFDWGRPAERVLEIRRLPALDPWLNVEPNAHVVFIDTERLELAFGTVRWLARDRQGLSVSAGDLAFLGRGEASISRDLDRVGVVVDSGRIDVWRDGALVGVVLGGQSRTFQATTPPDSSGEPPGEGEVHTRWENAYDALGASLNEALVGLIDAGVVSGSVLSTLWERTAGVLALYGYAEAISAPWVAFPLVARAELAEALRILAAFRFEVPPHRGM